MSLIWALARPLRGAPVGIGHRRGKKSHSGARTQVTSGPLVTPLANMVKTG